MFEYKMGPTIRSAVIALVQAVVLSEVAGSAHHRLRHHMDNPADCRAALVCLAVLPYWATPGITPHARCAGPAALVFNHDRRALRSKSALQQKRLSHWHVATIAH